MRPNLHTQEHTQPPNTNPQTHTQTHTISTLYLPLVRSPASTPEEMREEKKDQEGEKGAASEESRAAKAKASKPLMPTSTILRLLAELVRSYVGIATLIASYSYTAGQSELIKEVSTPPASPNSSKRSVHLRPAHYCTHTCTHNRHRSKTTQKKLNACVNNHMWLNMNVSVAMNPLYDVDQCYACERAVAFA